MLVLAEELLLVVVTVIHGKVWPQRRRKSSLGTDPKELFRLRKTKWMEQLARKGDYATILRAVHNCYEPLYATHPLLLGKESSSLRSTAGSAAGFAAAATGGTAAAAGEIEFQTVEYDDMATQVTEKHAMSLFRVSGQLDLALAVMTHRDWIASTLGKATLADDTQVDFGLAIAPYHLQALQTHFLLSNHVLVESIYDRAIAHGVPLLAKMTQTYVSMCIATKQFKKALAVYHQAHEKEKLCDVVFCRQLLYVARMTSKSTVARQILEVVRRRGYKLDEIAYFNAILSFDHEYYVIRDQEDQEQKDGANKHSPTTLWSRSLYAENYGACMKRIVKQARDPTTYAAIEVASKHVIELFEEMIHVHQLKPDKTSLFPRVMTAAMFLHQYDQIAG